DNRTGAEYTLPIVDGAIHATGLGQIKDADGAGLMTYDPAFMNTASCRSAITYIDGDAGILRYRGYPIEQVAEQATFLETAYLLLEGELPTAEQLAAWEEDVKVHTYVHTNIAKFVNMTLELGGRHEPNPVLQRALEILLILHADHEQNCSTSAVRSIGSSHVDPFSAVSGGIAALYGPLHGGANEAVLKMLDEI